MKTEVKPKIKSAFKLDDTEITRIKDAMNDQIKKNSGSDANFKYEVKYNNGVIAEHTAIGDITSEENFGSKSVRRVSLQAESVSDPDTKIIVNFSDISFDDDKDDYPISYEVYSSDKDWTFVTASIVDERIEKIRRNAFINLLLGGIRPEFFLFTMMRVFGAFISVSLAMKSPAEALAQIDAARLSSKDVFEYVYKIDRIQASRNTYYQRSPDWLMLATLVMMMAVFFIGRIKKIFPMYVFYWGDRVKSYDFRVGVIKVVLGSVGLAFLVGIITNFFYDWSGLGKIFG